MKPNYKNWVPITLVASTAAATAVSLVCCIIFAAVTTGAARVALTAIFAAAFLLFAVFTAWSIAAHRAFSYDGTRRLSAQMIEGVAARVKIPDGGVGLDVGCGSGALTIACAKKNPNAQMVGVDIWGAGYAFSKELCEDNAKAEGVANVRFERGNAVRLPYADESFDAVTSNYVYHNIKGRNTQRLIKETLRVLKKGGTFAIHDLMLPVQYGDMREFARELKADGYERVELIDTADGLFMSKREARRLMLKNSTLLFGVK
ncbi:MAG: class I SAM-dependent methyltransferase [Oscillospiraceae bacterium]|nr:class I SAM-dependent methyltransferase [Oscillospiraceae bacterium]